MRTVGFILALLAFGMIVPGYSQNRDTEKRGFELICSNDTAQVLDSIKLDAPVFARFSDGKRLKVTLTNVGKQVAKHVYFYIYYKEENKKNLVGRFRISLLEPGESVDFGVNIQNCFTEADKQRLTFKLRSKKIYNVYKLSLRSVNFTY